MKYITLIIGLLVVGCGTLKDKVIGTYAISDSSSIGGDGRMPMERSDTAQLVLLEISLADCKTRRVL